MPQKRTASSQFRILWKRVAKITPVGVDKYEFSPGGVSLLCSFCKIKPASFSRIEMVHVIALGKYLGNKPNASGEGGGHLLRSGILGLLPTEVKRFFLYLVWLPDSLY